VNNYQQPKLKQDFDQILIDIANYVLNYKITSQEAITTAHYCLLDSIGCGLEALTHSACTKLIGPIVPGATLTNGSRVFGTNFQLDPIQTAFNLGTLIRWLDFNDTWLAAEWGHPSDNLGAILAITDYLGRVQTSANMPKKYTILQVLEAMIKAHEIQGVIALENSFNAVGLDHVILVKLASCAVSCQLLNLTQEQTLNALSLVFTDGQALRTYRHAPNTGSRKSWAAGDASSRGLRLALMAQSGEMGYPTVLTTPVWGFYAASFRGNQFKFSQQYASYVMENILFKISYPAEFHAQTAVECAIMLHHQVQNKLEQISKITIRTHKSAIRIIDKHGPLNNPADRDHCIQYMVAVPLIYGRLTALDYEDNIAANPLIDELRAKMVCVEDAQFSLDYLDPNKRSIANGITIEFNNGTKLDEVVIEYPIGHKFRRKDGIPLLLQKFKTNLDRIYTKQQQSYILDMTTNLEQFWQLSVNEFMNALCNGIK
jgi:2-methylcitrate dehydratase